MVDVSCRNIGSAGIMLFLCVCVLSQMLGAPITLLSLPASADRFTESLSEDFSLSSTVPETETPSRPRTYREFQPSLQLQVFVTSVFHPPFCSLFHLIYH
jgi:hypothetical protein